MLIINELGDLQMRTYFESSDSPGGIICEAEGKKTKVFEKVQKIREESFEAVNGTFAEKEGERTCAIRVPRTTFFAVSLG